MSETHPAIDAYCVEHCPVQPLEPTHRLHVDPALTKDPPPDSDTKTG